jgi:pSer/pThr/pTyr-binding forkhead associated (FHA) protein
MNQSFVALAFQDATDSSIWIIIGVVLVLLFFLVVAIAVGLTIFIIMRKRKKAQSAAVAQMATGPSAGAIPYAAEPAGLSEAALAVEAMPAPEPQPPREEIRADAAEAAAPPAPIAGAPDFDPSRTVAITRENTVTISYGRIKFVSGVLAGQQFEVDPEGAYIGRESTLSQIVVADPRISKRHLWIGVRDGQVKIVDENSRNGTFINDPRSERVTEATLNSGDTVILGESDVARFEYEA